jgi:hypothetical protein
MALTTLPCATALASDFIIIINFLIDFGEIVGARKLIKKIVKKGY